MSRDQELEDFKSRIDLREYAAGKGYALDRRESWRGSAVMRTASDKIVIKRGPDGHYIYFSVRDDADNGSIIDFVKHRTSLTLGHIRKELRPWLGRAASDVPLFKKMERTTKDRLQVEQTFRIMNVPARHIYLEDSRGLSPALLASPRFAGRIRADKFNNAVFPHFDMEGLCGYELKNRGFTGFAPGGEKGLWISHVTGDDRCIVFAESAIDALSYATLFPSETTRYASIGGATSPKQPGIVGAAIQRMVSGSTVIAAMDNDRAGGELAALIETATQMCAPLGLKFRRHFPASMGEDWNDVIRKSPSSLFPAARL